MVSLISAISFAHANSFALKLRKKYLDEPPEQSLLYQTEEGIKVPACLVPFTGFDFID